MGIFGGKQQPDPLQNDDLVSGVPVDDHSMQQASIDGVLPSSSIHSGHHNTLSNTAPVVDDHTHDDDDDGYIMADPPAQQPLSQMPVTSVIDAPELAKHVVSEEFAANPAPLEPEPQAAEPYAAASTAGTSMEDLGAIKQQALQQLSPLVSHLDQSPEERFHTAMMMLQATDDHSLVKPAYEAAQSITDEKARAQALLDIVNEINYFTQQKN